MAHDYSKGPLARGTRGAFIAHSGPVTDIVEHYSWTVPNSGADMRTIERIHVGHNGWNGVGYHYGIHEDGRVSYGRPEWDADEVIDLVAANEVLALLDVHSYDPEVPVTPDPDKLTVITGPEPLVALAHMGLVLMETQEDVI